MTPDLPNLPFTLADAIIALVLVTSGLLALYRGFFVEILAVAGWIGAAVVTLTTFSVAQPYGRQIIPINLAADVVTGIVIFLASLLIISIITHSIANIVSGKRISWLDRLLGLLFGLVRGIVLLAFLHLVVAQVVPIQEQPSWITEARTLPMVTKTGEWLMLLVPKSLLTPDGATKLDSRETSKTVRSYIGMETIVYMVSTERPAHSL